MTWHRVHHKHPAPLENIQRCSDIETQRGGHRVRYRAAGGHPKRGEPPDVCKAVESVQQKAAATTAERGTQTKRDGASVAQAGKETQG